MSAGSPHYEKNLRLAKAAGAYSRFKIYHKLWLHVPWITYVPGGEHRCDGVKYSQVGVKHLFDEVRPDGSVHRAEGIPERAKCKHEGHWRYKALASNPRATSGVYCTFHVSAQLEIEATRIKRWVLRQKDKWDDPVLNEMVVYAKDWRESW